MDLKRFDGMCRLIAFLLSAFFPNRQITYHIHLDLTCQKMNINHLVLDGISVQLIWIFFKDEYIMLQNEI